MSIDERLRTGLVPREEDSGSSDEQVIDQLEGRARRRHKVRVRVGVAAVAAAASVAIAAAPVVWSNLSDDAPTVDRPTPTTITDTRVFHPETSSLDSANWRTRAHARASSLDSLDGTVFQRYGPKVFAKARLDGRITELELRFGSVLLSIDDYPEHGRATLWEGSFEASDTHVTFVFPELGTSKFRYEHHQEGRDHELRLFFVSADGPDRFGAPIEVLLRMALTSYPFASLDGP